MFLAKYLHVDVAFPGGNYNSDFINNQLSKLKHKDEKHALKYLNIQLNTLKLL